MKKKAFLGAAAIGLLFLGASAWPQDPPNFRNLFEGYVGQKCGVRFEDGLVFLNFPEDEKMNWWSATMTRLGTDFVQLRLQNFGPDRYIPLARVELWATPAK